MSIDATGAYGVSYSVNLQEETKKLKSKKYFGKLKEYIGNVVVCDFISENTVQTLTGVLEEITSYQSVVIDGKELTFIGKNIAIKTISDVRFPRVILYYNPELGYTYDGKDMYKERTKMFGYDIVEEETKKLIKNR